MVRFLSNAFFKSFSSKYVYIQYRQQQWRPLTAAHVLSPEYTVHALTPTCMWSAALNKQLQLYIVHFLRCQIIQNISDPAQWLHRVWGRGDDGNYWHNKPMNSRILNDIGRNSLLGKRKKIAKFLMRTFTYRSTFLYGPNRRSKCLAMHLPSRNAKCFIIDFMIERCEIFPIETKQRNCS